MDLNKFKNKHFLALMGNFVISGFSVLTISLLYRVLTKSDTGTWFLFLTFLGLADALRNGFLTTATVKFYAGTNKERGKTVLGSVWYLAIGITSIIGLIDIVFYLGLEYIKNKELILVIKWLGITFFSSLPYVVTYWILIAEEDYLKILWLRLINSGIMILVIIVLTFFNTISLYNVLLINLITNCFTSFIAIVWGLSKIVSLKKMNKECILEIFHFGKYSLATNISSNLLGSINTFIVTFVLGPSALAIYNLPQRLMEIIEIPLRSFVGTGMSEMAIAYNNNKMDHLVFITKKYAGMLTFAFIPIIIIGFFTADYAVLILGGTKYVGTDAANIFRFFLFFSILSPIDRFNGVTLEIVHQQKINLYKVLVMLCVNVPLAYLGIILLKNIWGVTIASPISILAGIILGYYHLRKHIKYSILEILQTGYQESLKFLKERVLIFPTNIKI